MNKPRIRVPSGGVFNASTRRAPSLNSDGTISAQCMDSLDFGIVKDIKESHGANAVKLLLNIEKINGRAMDEINNESNQKGKIELINSLVNKLSEFFAFLDEKGVSFQELPEEAQQVIVHAKHVIDGLSGGNNDSPVAEVEGEDDVTASAEDYGDDEQQPDLAATEAGSVSDLDARAADSKGPSELETWLAGEQIDRDEYASIFAGSVKQKRPQSHTSEVLGELSESAAQKRIRDRVYGRDKVEIEGVAMDRSSLVNMSTEHVYQFAAAERSQKEAVERQSAKMLKSMQSPERQTGELMQKVGGGAALVPVSQMENFAAIRREKNELRIKLVELKRRREEFADATNEQAAHAKYNGEIQDTEAAINRAMNGLKAIMRKPDGSSFAPMA